MKEIKARDLKEGMFFHLSQRKNARQFQAKIVEVITGEKWEKVINGGHVKEGQIFVMGQCFTKYAGQQVLDPDTPCFVNSVYPY